MGFRYKIVRNFKGDGEVYDKATETMVIQFLVAFFDITQTVFGGFLRGLGKQMIASAIAFINFYVIQTSLSILFGKVLGLGVVGIWMGIGC